LRSAYRCLFAPDPDGVSMFRTREIRLGKDVLYTPGTAVSTRPRMLHGRRLPRRSGMSLSPRYCIPAREVTLTRHHQGFPVSHPIPSFPLTCGSRSGRGPLGFSMSSAPGRYRPRTSWRGQVQTLTRSHVTGISQPPSTDSLLTCDLMSQALRIPHGSLSSVTCAPSPCGPAFPVARLAGRYSCDYYGHSVALGLASLRRSHVHQRYTF
jgi:hypothetical protein